MECEEKTTENLQGSMDDFQFWVISPGQLSGTKQSKIKCNILLLCFDETDIGSVNCNLRLIL